MTARIRLLICVLFAALAAVAQSPSTTTVQGTVYNAAGAPISGTLQITWPAFTTAANQAIAAGRLTVTIGADGFLSVNLAPNMDAMPAGLYYTVVYHLVDGTTSTEYWTVPAAPQATLAAVRALVMPAAQAVQAVNKAYVDQAIQQYAMSQVSTFGGTLSGPLYLNGDPLVPTQAADKHYVDAQFAQSLPAAGGAASGPLTATKLGAVYQADQLPGADFTAKLQACINKLDPTYGGVCDARNFTGALIMSAPITIATANATVQLPCATIATVYPIVVAPGTRNVTLHGCATRGTSSASGSQGGTAFLSSGSAALFQVGDSTYAADTLGFHLDNVAINTTAASASSAQAIAAWRTQEMQLTSLYLLGNSNQTALTLDGTGNYTGGTFSDIEIGGFQTAVNAIGHQVANSATTDWLNAGAFLRLHIDCPTSNGSPIPGTIGINLQAADGNTFTGGDVESCATALHLGPNAQNNTILGLRNENSTSQVVADPGSSYNNWITGGTMFTGKLTDNGTRNSFLDTFHRSFNALNGDWYGSQQDATLTNHFRLGIGSGNERGLLNRYQTDYGYRWTTGLTDASAGEQFYQVLDELNNVNRLSIGQYNNGQSSTNNQTVLNSAGTGAIVLNGSNNAGTGGVVIGSGGATSNTVAAIDKFGNANFTGAMQIGGTAQSTGAITVRNNADAEVDYYLWPGLTASQKGSFTYKDYSGNSQWYLVKDAGNNWALNSAIGGLDSFKAYQSTNSGDTYINASNSSGAVRINYEQGSGSAFNIYGGNSSSLYAGFTGPASIKFPGLAASAGHSCLQIDSTGYISNTGASCGGGGTVNSGILGQIAYYTATGAILAGLTAVPVSSGGTGASNAATAVANLGAVPAAGGTMTGPLTGTSASFSGPVTAGKMILGVHDNASFAPALSTLSSSGGTMEINGAVAISASQSIPANVQVTVKQGGSFSIGSGQTLTINGPFDAGLYQVFSGAGTAQFANTQGKVRPEWWGAKADGVTDNTMAINAALAAHGNVGGGANACVELSTGAYVITSTLQNGAANLCMEGVNQRDTLIEARAGTVLSSFINLYSPNGVYAQHRILRNFRLYGGAGTGYGHIGIYLENGVNNSLIEHVELTRCCDQQGFYSDGETWSNELHDVYVSGAAAGGPTGFTQTQECGDFTGEPYSYVLLNTHWENCGIGLEFSGFWALEIAGGGAEANTTVGMQLTSQIPAFSNSTYPGSGGGGGASIHGLYLESNPTAFQLQGSGVMLNGNFVNNANVAVAVGTMGLDRSTIIGNEFYSSTSALSVPANTYFTNNTWRDNRVESKTTEYPAALDNYQQYLIANTTAEASIYVTGNDVQDKKWLPQPGTNLITADLWNWAPPTSAGSVFQRSGSIQMGSAPVTEIKGYWANYSNTLAAPRIKNKYITIRGYVKRNDTSTDHAQLRLYDGTSWMTFYLDLTPNAAYASLADDIDNGWIEYSIPYRISAAATNFQVQIGSLSGDFLWTTPSIVEGLSTANMAQGLIGRQPLAGTTAAIGGSPLAAGACASGTATIAGATPSMVFDASPTTYPGDAFTWRAYYSAANTATVSICNSSSASGTPAAATYNVRVIP